MCLLRLFNIHQQEKNGLDWTEVIKVLNKLNKEITDKQGIRKKDNPDKKEKDLLLLQQPFYFVN